MPGPEGAFRYSSGSTPTFCRETSYPPPPHAPFLSHYHMLAHQPPGDESACEHTSEDGNHSPRGGSADPDSPTTAAPHTTAFKEHQDHMG